jgi:hypothetical protein
MFLGFDIGPEYRVHAGQMAFPIFLKPIHYIAIQAKMNGGFSAGHDDAGVVPEISAQRLSLRCIGACFVFTLGPQPPDLAKGVCDDGRFLVHLCSLSVR